MNFFKQIAEFFSKKKEAAQLPPLTNVRPTTSEEEACKVAKLGKTDIPLFIPQTLMAWYGMYKAFNTREASFVNISQIEVLNLHHPLTNAFIETVFAIKCNDYFYWGAIGTDTVYRSKENAFHYERAHRFRIFLRESKNKDIVAVCKYTKGEVIVTSLLWQLKTPPTDNDREVFIECPFLPCDLKTAGQFAMKIQSLS